MNDDDDDDGQLETDQVDIINALCEIGTATLSRVWRSGLCLRTSITTTWLRSLINIGTDMYDTYDDDGGDDDDYDDNKYINILPVL